MTAFKNKVALITGGGSGIGLEVTRQLLNLGARVVINGRNPEKLAQAANELDATGENIQICEGSVSETGVAERLVATAVSAFGRLDILINNAGVFKPTAFLDHTEADFDRYLDIILKGKFFTAQAAVRQFIKQGTGGAIVHTGSMWALQAVGATPSSAYSAANAGVHQLVKNIAIEHAKDKIRINAVAPAVVETPVYNTFLSDAEVRKILPTFNSFHPLGRNGQPGDVARAIVFLASDDAAWITGTVLPVDGGVMAGR